MEELELKDGMKVICPIKVKYFTKGKEYVVYNVKKSKFFGFTFETNNDFGNESFCLLRNCNQIKNENWIIKK